MTSVSVTLHPPDTRRGQGLAAMVAEFGDPLDQHGAGWWHWGAQVPALDGVHLDAVVQRLLSYTDPDAAYAEGLVPCDYLWIVEASSDQLVGFLALRHELNDFLLEQGGHIGYSVRPSRRGEGIATAALVSSLGRAAERGLRRVLVTCDHDNEWSRRTIERAGGVLEDRRGDKLRYWIDTDAGAGLSGSDGAARGSA